MIRAVLDTSVLVSALITPNGPPGGVLDAAERGDFTLCLSPPILAETLDVLTRDAKLQERYRFDLARAEGFCDGLLQTAELSTDLPELPGAVPLDPKDDVIVAPAVAAKADYLVTGDRKHLPRSVPTRASRSSSRERSSTSSAKGQTIDGLARGRV